MLRFKRKAQHMIEYAVLIALVAAGLIMMQSFVKRAVQGNLQSAADDIGEQFSANAINEFNYNYSQISNTTENVANGTTTSTLREAEVHRRTVNVDLQSLDNEDWQ